MTTDPTQSTVSESRLGREKPAHNYDKTQARRQAKRRALFARMRDALERIENAETLDEAKRIARDGRDESFSEKDAD